jgi:hypothetical protein
VEDILYHNIHTLEETSKLNSGILPKSYTIHHDALIGTTLYHLLYLLSYIHNDLQTHYPLLHTQHYVPMVISNTYRDITTYILMDSQVDKAGIILTLLHNQNDQHLLEFKEEGRPLMHTVAHPAPGMECFHSTTHVIYCIRCFYDFGREFGWMRVTLWHRTIQSNVCHVMSCHVMSCHVMSSCE